MSGAGRQSLAEQAADLASGATTATALAECALNRAAANKALNAFVALVPDAVLAQAAAADRRRRAGQALSPIDGVPIAVKDNYLTQDYPTTACSLALPDDAGGVDATVVGRLRAAGAVIFGKTNMHEWAFGATNATSSIGPTRNPHDTDRITGGSSGGSGAAVAAGIVAAALGSDTGGSVRIPSAACGIYGFKPSYGRASRHGVLPLSWSLDAPGPMTAALADIPLLLPYFFGEDRNDPTTHGAAPFAAIPEVETPRVVNLVGAGLERSEEVGLAVAQALKTSGALVRDHALENVESYFAAWEAILHGEASAYHAGRMERTPQAFSPATEAHLAAGAQLTAVELLQAQQIRARFVDVLLHGIGAWDAIALPTLPVVAPRHGDDWQEFGGRRVTTQDSMTWFCWIGNLAGLPCVSIPVPVGSGQLPVGLMLMGRPGEDERLLAIAQWVDGHLKGAC